MSPSKDPNVEAIKPVIGKDNQKGREGFGSCNKNLYNKI